MLAEDLRCLLCLGNISGTKDYARSDATCQYSRQTYLSLLNGILDPGVIERRAELLFLCRVCQELADNFEHHQVQVISVKNVMLQRSRSVNSTKVAEISNDECAISSSCFKKCTTPSCPDWQDLGPPCDEKRDQTSDLKSSKLPSEQQKLSSQSRLWTVRDNGKTYQCTLCDKKFAHRTYMYTHVRIHTGDRPHACASCPRSFRSSSALSEHERSAHSSGAQFSCELCGQTFVHASSLRQHLRRHRQQASHRCADCGKTFHRAAHLREHAAVHSQRRPHACTVCGKTFKNRSGLVYHGRIHSGERPHQCKVCSAQFRTTSNLARHVQTQHGGAASVETPDEVAARLEPPPATGPAPSPLPPVTRSEPLQTASQPPPPPPPSQQQPQPPRFDLLQPPGFQTAGAEFELTHPHHHHAAATRGLPGAASFDRCLQELLPVPLETYRPL